jgi:hypothetical protein
MSIGPSLLKCIILLWVNPADMYHVLGGDRQNHRRVASHDSSLQASISQLHGVKVRLHKIPHIGGLGNVAEQLVYISLCSVV